VSKEKSFQPSSKCLYRHVRWPQVVRQTVPHWGAVDRSRVCVSWYRSYVTGYLFSENTFNLVSTNLNTGLYIRVVFHHLVVQSHYVRCWMRSQYQNYCTAQRMVRCMMNCSSSTTSLMERQLLDCWRSQRHLAVVGYRRHHCCSDEVEFSLFVVDAKCVVRQSVVTSQC